MTFFSGFGFANEAPLFEPFLPEGEARFTAAGFSLGAIRAFEYALSAATRIEQLILLSPAFFQDQSDKFRRMQLMGFNKSADSYFSHFYDACDPSCAIDAYKAPGHAEDLAFLLDYRWDEAAVKTLIDRGTRVTVYLGGKDKIINASAAAEFFSRLCEVYFLKNAGHLLHIKDNHETH